MTIPNFNRAIATIAVTSNWRNSIHNAGRAILGTNSRFESFHASGRIFEAAAMLTAGEIRPYTAAHIISMKCGAEELSNTFSLFNAGVLSPQMRATVLRQPYLLFEGDDRLVSSGRLVADPRFEMKSLWEALSAPDLNMYDARPLLDPAVIGEARREEILGYPSVQPNNMTFVDARNKILGVNMADGIERLTRLFGQTASPSGRASAVALSGIPAWGLAPIVFGAKDQENLGCDTAKVINSSKLPVSAAVDLLTAGDVNCYVSISLLAIPNIMIPRASDIMLHDNFPADLAANVLSNGEMPP
ncbi:MAG: hypothetical protein AABZ57_00840, partial [Candidatus Margulisiibacteriota bacterium]